MVQAPPQNHRHYRAWLAPSLAALLGLLMFFAAFPAYIANPANLDWIFHKPSFEYHAMDFHQHYLGWYFLRHATPSFPLGAIPNFVAPLNTYLAYTDSLPLLAFPLRLISGQLPEDFQYLGIWVVLCCILQGLFAWRLLRRLISNGLILWSAVLLLTFSPILIWRWNHVALMTHWLLLWCIEINVEHYRDVKLVGAARIPVWRPVLLIALGSLVQPYLAVMIGGLCWAMPFGRWLQERPRQSLVRKPQAWICATLRLGLVTVVYMIPIVVVMYVFGFLQVSSRGEGFHWFATDWFSLFNNHGTSSLIPAFRSKAGLAEGYAWPGLGGWLLLVCALRRKSRQWIRESLKKYSIQALVVVCGLMWFFALGERWFFGTFWLVDMSWFWGPFGFITSSLRTCGRFVWPGYYLILVGSAVVVSRSYHKSIANKIFVLAVVLQAVDLGPWITNRSLRYPIYGRQMLTDGFWETEGSKYRHIKLIPPHQEGSRYCYRGPGDRLYEWPELARFAAKHHMTINSGYLARYDSKVSFLYCGADWYEFIAGKLRDDTLYVVREPLRNSAHLVGADRVCKTVDGYLVCQPQAQAKDVTQ
jgi:hypothetical protein